MIFYFPGLDLYALHERVPPLKGRPLEEVP